MDTTPEQVVARRFTNVLDAHLAKSVIEAAGIDVELMDEHVVSMNWMYSNLVGGVTALVAADRLDDAHALLTTSAVLVDAPDSAADGVDDRCASCGSNEFESFGPQSSLLILTWLIIGVPLGWPMRRRICRQCGEPARRSGTPLPASKD
jgi:hypothetical protein